MSVRGLTPVVAAFAALTSLAAAAALTDADAARIARDADVAGLRALVEQRDTALLYRATQSWNFGNARALPEPLEALIVEHYADSTERPLLGLIARSLDNAERYPKYRSRRLFDLLYADLKAGKGLGYAIRIIATDLEVEPQLAALLPSLDPASANEIVMFLGARKYAPALPALKALQARIPHPQNTNQMLERVDWAYLQIGTREAMQALFDRLRLLGASQDPRAASELWSTLVALTQLAPESPPDYAELRAVLPAELSDNDWDMLIRLIVKRKEKRGVPDLVRAIGESHRADQAVDALLAIGGVADWRAGREALARASGPQAAALQKKLDVALADPAKFAAQREERSRAEEYYRGESELAREKMRIARLRQTEPQRYVAQTRALLERREARLRELGELPQAAGARQQLAREYIELGGFLRFELHQPDEAIAAYASAPHGLPGGPFDLMALYLADIERFDKHDARKAAEQYRRALASPGQDERLVNLLKPWIQHELDYLEHGRRFSGALTPADVELAFLWLGLASMQGPVQPPPDARTLSRLPPSQFQIARALPAVLDLAPGEMLAFFDKHDPAGYLTASILAFALYKEPSPYVKAAAATFFRSRGIRGPFAAAGDPRFASPEKTWSSFLAAAKKGSAPAMLECFTFEMQGKLAELFRRMSREDLRRMAESFVAFSMMEGGAGEYREAAIVRELKDRRAAGIVTFTNEGGAWKIASM